MAKKFIDGDNLIYALGVFEERIIDLVRNMIQEAKMNQIEINPEEINTTQISETNQEEIKDLLNPEDDAN